MKVFFTGDKCMWGKKKLQHLTQIDMNVYKFYEWKCMDIFSNFIKFDGYFEICDVVG